MAKDRGGKHAKDGDGAVAPEPKVATGTSAQLAAEIERTRDELAQTLDAIADKVSPKRVAKRGTAKVTETVKGTVASAKEAVSHQRDHEPEDAPRGHSLSEPGQSGGRNPLALEIGFGAVVAIIALVLLRRRRR